MAKKKQIDKNKILATANADIKWADDYYKEHIEQDLIRRYEVYYSERERYRKQFPKLSQKNEMRTFDLWSAVEWMLPDMLKAFFGSNRIISITGVGSEDADRAEQIMELLQWQLTVKNTGYRVFKSWFGDALATNLGVLKCYWKRETKTVPHRETLDHASLVGVLQSPNNKIVSSEPVPDIMSALGLAPPTAMVEWEEEVVTTNQPVIEAIRPSDIRFTPDGKTLSECSMVAHRKIVTIDRLRKDAKRGMYDKDVVDRIAKDGNDDPEPTELEQHMDPAVSEATSSQRGNSEVARRRVVLYECYLKSDIDGDGQLEDAIVTVCNGQLLRAVENPYGRAPFFDLVPFWDSYRVWARLGLSEVIQDTQDSHTALLRQMLVSLGLSNQPRSVVDETAINMDDLVNDAMYIRSKGIPQNAFMPLNHGGMNAQNFQFLEYLRTQLEEWTPMTRYNQGMDSSSLNKTATGVSMIMGASQQRKEEIVRNFAETGIRELFRFLIQLNQRYLDQTQVVRLQNKTFEFTPDDLDGDYDLSVDASTGVGAIDSKVQVLTSYLREMFPFAVQLGVVGPEQFVMAGQKLLRLMGIEDADKFLPMPQMPQMQMMPGMMGMGGGDVGGVEQPGAALPAGPGGGSGANGPGGLGGLL